MKHARADYDCIQPWPTRRPHVVKFEGETVTLDPHRELLTTMDGRHVGFDTIEPIIPDDEPVFLIRGQDLAAIPAAEAWCEAAAELGADPEIIATVRKHIELVREWQTEHSKVPDAPSDVLR
jgi:hypothetical protein